MTARIDDEIVKRPEEWSRLSDADWVALHVPRFQKARGGYEAYASFLRRVLNQICDDLKVKAMVTTRTKQISSFAQKILCKRPLYTDCTGASPSDPLVRMTDLCGGRIIVQTSQQVDILSQFIERAFVIDWTNSRDMSRRLKPTELGYRSVHYIVTVDPERLRRMGLEAEIPAPLAGLGPEVAGPTAAGRPLKAEIQVRTLLEHAWCELQHDMIYKAEFKVPDMLLRRFAVVEAILEEADWELGQLVQAFAAYRANVGAHHSRSDVEEEIERQKIVLECEPENLHLAMKIAQLCQAIGRHDDARRLLDREPHRAETTVRRFLGQLLTESHWNHPAGVDFQRGCDLLNQVCRGEEPDAEALCALAECLAHCEKTEQARALFERAVALDATQPLVLCRYLEFEIEKAGNTRLARFAAPMIRSAMSRARRQIEARVNLPHAWFSLAVFHLLLREPFHALSALGQVAWLCDTADDPGRAYRPCAAGRILQRATATIERLRPVGSQLEGYTCFERLLLLILAERMGDGEARDRLASLVSPAGPMLGADDRVVILCGSGVPDAERCLQAVREPLLRAAEGPSFTLLRGARAGIGGLADDLVARSGGRVRQVDYVPVQVSCRTFPDAERSGRHDASNVVDPVVKEALQMWIDLIHAGIRPQSVRLLCYAPDEVAHVQCAVALALGARVGVIQDPRLPAARQFDASEWTMHPCFAPLPLDAMTLRAFLHIDTTPLDAEAEARLEQAARLAHEDYVRSATPEDPSLQRWNKLDSSLKLSDYHQVAYWEKVLHEHKLRVRPLTEEDKSHDPLDMQRLLGETVVKQLAQMEHGRWNIERLYSGWRFACKKDVTKKLSPYLLPWSEVPPKIQELDIEAIRGLPRKLREAGLELYCASA